MTPPASRHDDYFTNFVRDTFDPITRCAVKWCRDRELAKDLTQRAYIRVLERHDPDQELTLGYALRSLWWIFIDNARADNRDRQCLAGYLDECDWLDVASLGDPAELVADRAEIQWLARNYLDPSHTDITNRIRQWEVLFLTAVGGYKSTEVASFLGLASGTVRNYLTTVRKGLRKLSSTELSNSS